MGAVYFVLFGTTYYYQIFAVRVFQHLFTTIFLSLWLVLRLARRRGLPPTPLNPLLYLCVILWFVSALLSLDPRMALENLWFPVTNLLLFFVMVDFLQSGSEGLLIETQFLLAALIVILSGLQLGSWFFGWGFATPAIGWASVLGSDLVVPLAPPRLFVPLGVTTWLAAYTAPLAVIAGVWGVAARRHSTRNVLWFLAVLLVLVMVLTNSRGGWFSLAAGVVLFLSLHLFSDPRYRQLIRRYRVPLLLGLAAVLAIGVLVIVRLSSDSGHATGDILRFDLWRGALAITADHPVFGVGPGLFGRAYRLDRDPLNIDNRLGTAHNFLLNTLAETGIVGGLIAVGLGVVLLLAWWRLWRHAETPGRKIHLEGALAALVGFGVQSVFDTFTAAPLVLLALLLAAYCVTPLRSRLESVSKGNILAAVASLLVVLAFGIGMFRSDQAQAAFIASVNGAPERVQEAIVLDHGLHLYTLEQAYLMGQNGQPPQAIVAYQQALALEPTWDTGWINLAALFERQGNTEEALQALTKAINIDNHNGALLMWARLAEESNSASTESIRDAYLRALRAQYTLPLSVFWSETALRKQALALYLQGFAPDIHYRITAAQNASDLAALVPAKPSTAAEWWVVGEYALSTEKDVAKAEEAFTEAIALGSNDYLLGDYYASRARARVTTDQQGALRDLNIAELLGPINESPNAVRALLTLSVEERRRLLAAAVPTRVLDQNFEGVLFGGRVAGFDVLPEMRLPGPGHSVMQPWYDLATSYLAAGQNDQAANVYRAILDRAPEETDAQNQLASLINR